MKLLDLHLKQLPKEEKPKPIPPIRPVMRSSPARRKENKPSDTLQSLYLAYYDGFYSPKNGTNLKKEGSRKDILKSSMDILNK